MRRSRSVVTIVGVLAVAAGAGAGCPAKPQLSADEYVEDCETADAGVPSASDESFAAFVNAAAAKTVVADECKAPQLLRPSAGDRLDPKAPPTFEFLPKGASCQRDRRGQTLGCATPRRSSAGLRWLGAVVSGLEGTAWAHCGAFTGENYLLRLTRSGDAQPVYSALLSVTAFTPDVAIWRRALSGRAGQTLTLTVERGAFLRGDLHEGPFVQPQPPTFVVGP